MIHRISIIIAVLFLLGSANIIAQEQLKINLESTVSLTSDDISPMWLSANEWGKYTNEGGLNGMLYASGEYDLLNKDLFSLNVGTGFVLNTDFNTSFLHEVYVNGHFWIVDYTIGKEANSWVAYNDGLSSGHFLMSQNARPIPKVTLGFEDYRKVGFLNNWLEVKGGITQGILNDDRGDHSRSADNLLLHEKWVYGRLGNTKVQPYVGFVHSALFGGTRPDGTKLDIDFWPTFFAKGSAKLGGGEETNAAGAHMGLWDFGFYFGNDKYDLQFYYQKPFADGSGMKIWNRRNKDYIIGLLVYPKEIKWLKGVSLEFIKTDVQSDYGIPDPLYPSESERSGIVWMEHIDEYASTEEFMYANFPYYTGDVTGWTKDDVQAFLVKEYNHGYEYGGRDDYMNNGTYFNGWTYHGASMGTPLFHTAEIVQKYYGGELNNHNLFINNRITGFHLGVEGSISENIDFRFKSTYTINYGAYSECFINRDSWVRVEDFFYEGGKKQLYTMLEAAWKMPYVKGLQLNGNLAYDFGQLYHSFGGRVGVVYCPFN